MGAVKQYPQAMKVASFYSIIGTIQSATLSFFVLETDIDAWKLNVNMEIPLIILTVSKINIHIFLLINNKNIP